MTGNAAELAQRDQVAAASRDGVAVLVRLQRDWHTAGDGRLYDPNLLALVLGGDSRVNRLCDGDVRHMLLALVDAAASGTAVA